MNSSTTDRFMGLLENIFALKDEELSKKYGDITELFSPRKWVLPYHIHKGNSPQIVYLEDGKCPLKDKSNSKNTKDFCSILYSIEDILSILLLNQENKKKVVEQYEKNKNGIKINYKNKKVEFDTLYLSSNKGYQIGQMKNFIPLLSYFFWMNFKLFLIQ